MMEVLEKIKKNYSAEDGELLLSAYKYAEEMHSGQKRGSRILPTRAPLRKF